MALLGTAVLVGLWATGAATLVAAAGRGTSACHTRAARPRNRTWCASILRWEPLIIGVLVPFFLFPSRSRIAVLGIALVLPIASRFATGAWVPPTPLNPALTMLAVMSTASLAVTPDIGNSLGKVSGVWLGLLIFWAIVRWCDTPARVRTATSGAVVAAGALAVVSLLGTRWHTKFTVLGDVAAHLPAVIRGTPGAEDGFHPNAVAGTLVIFLPLQLALLRLPRRDALPGLALPFTVEVSLLILTAVTLLLTQSRGAWAGLVLSLAVTACWQSRRARHAAAALLGVTVLLVATLGLERILSIAVSFGGPMIAENIDGRLELWDRAARTVADFPFTGVGMNTFRRLMPSMYPTLQASPDTDIAHAHNHLLQTALDLGLPGLIAYLAVWMGAAAALSTSLQRASRTHIRALAGGLAAGFTAHWVFSMTDAIPLGSKVGVLVWGALALAVASSRDVPGPESSHSRNPACTASA